MKFDEIEVANLPPEPWWQSALDVVLPPRCVGCGRRGAEVCAACIAALRPLGAAICPRCALPSVEGRVCSRCSGREHALRAILAHYPFEGVIRSAILGVKYRGRRRLIPFLAKSLELSLRSRPLDVDAVLPVPLGPSRLRDRGFNQSELLARALAASLGLPCEIDVVERHLETAPQTGLTARDRRMNVANAFAVPHPRQADGRRLLLVDDVCTTGATLEACARPLMAAGAQGVWAVVAAREV